MHIQIQLYVSKNRNYNVITVIFRGIAYEFILDKLNNNGSFFALDVATEEGRRYIYLYTSSMHV